MNTFARRLANDIPLMSVEVLAYLADMTATADDVKLAEHPSMKRMREACATKSEVRDGVAHIPVRGTLAHNPDPYEVAFLGVEDSGHVRGMIGGAIAASDVKGVLLHMDSPGGMMMGGPEVADAVLACRRAGKPVVAHIGGMGASLGYMIASQANEVIANRSAIVGSIGVIASVPDFTRMLEQMGIKIEYFTNREAKFKAAGAVGTSLNLEQRDYVQSQVDGAFKVFKSAVTSVRPQVKTEAMQGQTFRGSEAKALGLVDRVGDESFALSVLKSLMRN